MQNFTHIFAFRGMTASLLRALSLALLLSFPLGIIYAESGQAAASTAPQTSPPPPPLPHKPAGITLYAEEDGKIFLLLADHAMPARHRGWAGFGGMNEFGESTAQTAARETEEETNGYFSREYLLKLIEGQPPLLDDRFTFYFAKVPKVPVEEISGRHSGLLSRFYRERVNYAWVPWQQVARYLDVKAAADGRSYTIDASYLPEKAPTNWLWPVWVNNFRVAERAGRLPWQRSGTPVEGVR